MRDRRIAVRWPANPIWDELRRLDLPLLSIAVPGAVTADDFLRLVGEDTSAIVDAGPSGTGVLPTVVDIDGRRHRIRFQGQVPTSVIDETALCRIVFICTGNTCRSPMAEVFCAKMLADALGCAPADLRSHGYSVHSAGLGAMRGGPASPEAVQVAGERGADLSLHRSQMVTLDMLAWADHVFTMTANHAYALVSVPNIPEPRLLSPEGDAVSDPIGGDMSDYRTCADQIIQYLKQRLPALLES